MSKQSPAGAAKELGCKSLKKVCIATGQHHGTIARWYTQKPDLFRIVCKGFLAEQSEGEPVKLTDEIRERVVNELVSGIKEDQ